MPLEGSSAVSVEVDGTREELKSKKEALVKMERELKVKQSELNKIQEEYKEYKRTHECTRMPFIYKYISSASPRFRFVGEETTLGDQPSNGSGRRRFFAN